MGSNNMDEIEYNELETCELSEDEKELSEDEKELNDIEVDHDCLYYLFNSCRECHISLLGLMCCFLYIED